MSRRLAACVTVALAIAVAREARAEETQLAAEEAAGVVAVEGESRLSIQGLAGHIQVRVGREGEVRFMSTALGDTSKKIPVAVWLTGSLMRLTPAAGTEDQPRELEVVVDPGLLVQVSTSNGAVTAGGLQTGLEVSGQVLDVDARGIAGPVQIETQGGRARIEGIAGDVSVRSRSTAVSVARIEGSLFLQLEDSTLDAVKIAGAVEGEIRASRWSLDGVQQPLRIRSFGGSAEVKGLVLGGEIRLSATPIVLTECKGDLDVETDAELRFQKTAASLHVNSFGGSVTGLGNEGLLEVRTDGSHVNVAEIVGPMRVQGQNLTLRLKGVSGELFVDAKSSDLEIDGAGGTVSVLAKNSTVVLKNLSQAVDVECDGGQVEILDLRGSLEVNADSERVLVTWAMPFPSKNSTVKNTGGTVEMQFPPNYQAQVEADSRFGSVESELPGLEINEEANQIRGKLGQGANAPMIRIQANRDIVLTQTSSTEE